MSTSFFSAHPLRRRPLRPDTHRWPACPTAGSPASGPLTDCSRAEAAPFRQPRLGTSGHAVELAHAHV